MCVCVCVIWPGILIGKLLVKRVIMYGSAFCEEILTAIAELVASCFLVGQYYRRAVVILLLQLLLPPLQLLSTS